MDSKATIALIAVVCLSPLSIAAWLLRRRLQTSPPDLPHGRQKMLKLGVSLGFVSCASVIGLFVLSLFWNPHGPGSVEAPNTLLSLLALFGNLCNLVALVSSLASWSKKGLVASVLLGTNQLLWFFVGFLIVAAHGF